MHSGKSCKYRHDGRKDVSVKTKKTPRVVRVFRRLQVAFDCTLVRFTSDHRLDSFDRAVQLRCSAYERPLVHVDDDPRIVHTTDQLDWGISSDNSRSNQKALRVWYRSQLTSTLT